MDLLWGYNSDLNSDSDNNNAAESTSTVQSFCPPVSMSPKTGKKCASTAIKPPKVSSVFYFCFIFHAMDKCMALVKKRGCVSVELCGALNVVTELGCTPVYNHFRTHTSNMEYTRLWIWPRQKTKSISNATEVDVTRLKGRLKTCLYAHWSV